MQYATLVRCKLSKVTLEPLFSDVYSSPALSEIMRFTVSGCDVVESPSFDIVFVFL